MLFLESLSASRIAKGAFLLALVTSSTGAQDAAQVEGNQAALDAGVEQAPPASIGADAEIAPDAAQPAPDAEPPSHRDAGVSPAEPEGPADGATDAEAQSAPAVVSPASPAAQEGASGTQPSALSNESASSAVGSASAIEVQVSGRAVRTGLDRSSNAVTVVDLQRAKLESSDLAAVLARTEGVNVQRAGGLGSQARFSLAGFDDTQIRFFVDGVPLEYAGYSFGLQNVPVNFAKRVEIHKGVVPVRLGADALGGAFDLITDRSTRGTRAMASYGLGSFGTHRLNAGLRHRDAGTGLFAKAEAFFDKSENDYPVRVKVSDRTGITKETTAYRFHDAYKASGGNLELGIVDKPWARRLLARGFITDYDKELPHNVIMTVPWGEARSGGRSWGASLRYENDFAHTSIRAVAGYANQRADLYDKPGCNYDWFGQCRTAQLTRAELGTMPSDRTIRDQSGFLRATIEQTLHPNHKLSFATAPTYTKRMGDDRLVDAFDGYENPKRMLKWITGLEYEANAFDDALQNMLFVKSYFQEVGHHEVAALTKTKREKRRALWGVGDGLRYNILPWLFAKASYEYAIRLAEPRETFGDGQVIYENVALRPERSHNTNLSLAVSQLVTLVGTFDGAITGFHREASDLMILAQFGDILQFQNIRDARALGVEGSFMWVSPGEYVELWGNITYQDSITQSRDARVGKFQGDRIPNRPYFWANARLRLQKRAAFAENDELSLTWHTRFVRSFYLNWEGAGRKGPEDAVPDQLVHSAVLSYLVRQQNERLIAFTSEVQNITDARNYDFYGVQKPGIAVFGKVTLVF
jgi:vitamin B12 transporter